MFQGTLISHLSQLTLFGNGTAQSIAIFSSQITISDVIVLGAKSSSGAAVIAYDSTVDILGQNAFINNTATASRGGAIELHNCIFNFSGNISFINNTAYLEGGALALIGGKCNISGNTSFINNTVTSIYGGGAIFCQGSVVSFSGLALFQHNQARTGGAIAAYHGRHSTLSFETTSKALFTENTALSAGGAISVSASSNLTILGSALFEKNVVGWQGGAINVDSNSRTTCSGNITF